MEGMPYYSIIAMHDISESQIDQINRSIIDSYRNLGGINHINGPNLPSRRGVEHILETFESLIFPGFQVEERLEDSLIAYTIGAKTHRLVRELTLEISRSLEFASRASGRETSIGACIKKAEEIALHLLSQIPSLRQQAMCDVEAAYSGDPAALSHEEVILSYPCIEAIVCHRIAHELYTKTIPLIPRMMSEYIHGKTGIDIHPGATIGNRFFIDHATGVVIGETSVIGNDVKIYQGVTIGALSVAKELAMKKRHPTIEDEVTIYAGATILGGKTCIGKGSVIGGNVWITNSIPPYSVVNNKPADYRVKNRYAEGGIDHWSI